MKRFCTQQAEAAQDLIMVLDSGRVTVIDRDGQLRRGNKGSVSLKSQISLKMIDLRLKILKNNIKKIFIYCTHDLFVKIITGKLTAKMALAV